MVSFSFTKLESNSFSYLLMVLWSAFMDADISFP